MRRVARWLHPLVLFAAILALSSCVKLDADFRISGDDTLSGTYVLAVAKSLVQLSGLNADQLYQQLAGTIATGTRPDGATISTEKYEDSTFVGVRIAVDNLPIDQLADLGDGASRTGVVQFSLTHDGDVYHFAATIDPTAVAGANTDVSVPDQVKSQADLRVQLTFPGEVTDTNGTKDDTSVTWHPALDQRQELTATANDSGGATRGGGSNSWLVVVAILAGLAAVVTALVALLINRKRGSSHRPLVHAGPPPPLSVLAPPRPAEPPPAAAARGRPLPPPPPSSRAR